MTAIVRRLYKSRYTNPFANPCFRWKVAVAHAVKPFRPDRNLNTLFVGRPFPLPRVPMPRFTEIICPTKLDLVTDAPQNGIEIFRVKNWKRADVYSGRRFLYCLDRRTSRNWYFLSSFEISQRRNICERRTANGPPAFWRSRTMLASFRGCGKPLMKMGPQTAPCSAAGCNGSRRRRPSCPRWHRMLARPQAASTCGRRRARRP